MKNVYDIRYEKNLTFILSEKAYDSSEKIAPAVYEQTAIIIYLYYVDTISTYCGYMDNIPGEIDIYIISSREEVLGTIRKYIEQSNKKNVWYILKENRGRDVSALLVASRNIIEQYQYVCFLHDKKEHLPQEKPDIDLWITNLWGNQIGSPEYIDEIIRMFEQQESLGILAPPEPIGDNCNTWFGYGWYGAYDITKQIATQMELHADIRRDKPPITFGTVLWFKTEALKKLFHMKWKYEDFCDEKLKEKNYLSYGLERIFAYVAQDAGYETATVMTRSYAEKQMSYLQYSVNKIMHEKDDFFPISEISRLNVYIENREKVAAFGKGNKQLYLYGAGQMGRFCLSMLRQNGIFPLGFIITDGGSGSRLCGIPVILIEELEAGQDIAVIITVEGLEAQKEIISELKKRRINNYIRFWDR